LQELDTQNPRWRSAVAQWQTLLDQFEINRLIQMLEDHLAQL
jgi:hypothetical protein